MPRYPPVSGPLLRTSSWIRSANPKVATARLTPRVRRAGRAINSPSGMAAAIAARRASSNGTPCATRRAATQTPKPPRANWQSESWPQSPVTTTTERITIAQPIVVAKAVP